MSDANRKLAYISVAKVVESKAALRELDRSSEKYNLLVANIKNIGVLKPILVHETVDAETGEQIYGLSDGMNRLNAAKDAGLTEIPAHIVPLDEARVLEAQFMANFHTIEMDPLDYSKGIIRMMGMAPTMNLSDICTKLQVNVDFVKKRLSLLKLKDEYQTLVTENKLNLTNAYTLAKLEHNEQENFVDRAQTQDPEIFVKLVNDRVKELRDEKRKGREAGDEKFVVVAHAKKKAVIEQEISSGSIADVYKSKGLISSTEDFKLALQWTLHLDPASVEAAKNDWETEKKAAREKAQAKKAASDAKKLAEAQEVLAAHAATTTPA